MNKTFSSKIQTIVVNLFKTRGQPCSLREPTPAWPSASLNRPVYRNNSSPRLSQIRPAASDIRRRRAFLRTCGHLVSEWSGLEKKLEYVVDNFPALQRFFVKTNILQIAAIFNTHHFQNYCQNSSFRYNSEVLRSRAM